MARTYLGVWSTYFLFSNTGTPSGELDVRGRYKFYYEQNKELLTTTAYVEHYLQVYSTRAETIEASAITSRVTVNSVSDTKTRTARTQNVPSGYSEYLIGTSTFTIQHDSEGKANLSFSARFTTDGVTRTASHTWALPDIELASTIASNVNEQTLGQLIQFTITPKEQTYIHVLKYKYGTSAETQIATNVGTSYNWTPPISLAQYVTNNTYGTATIYCYAYDGSISDDNYKGVSSTTVKLNIPDNVIPSGTLSVTDINTTSNNEQGKVPSTWGIFVKGYSKLRLQANLTMSYNATLKSVLMTACDGQSGTTNPFNSTQNVSVSGNNLNNTCLVTDSRGRTNTISSSINVYDYENPSVSLNVVRSNSDGTYNANGTNAKVTINYQISSLSNNNLKQYILKYRAKGSTAYINIQSGTLSSYNGVLNIIITNITFDIGTTYEFVVEIIDQFNTTSATATMAYSRKPISVKKTKGVTFGRHAVDDGFNVYYDAKFYGLLDYGVIAFENNTGDNGNLTLDYDSANYNHCIIFFRTNDSDNPESSVRIDEPNGKTAMLIGTQPYANSRCYIKSKKVLISGTSITNVSYSQVELRSSNYPAVTNDNNIYITKVIFF